MMKDSKVSIEVIMCPVCQRPTGRYVFYGYPTPEVEAAVEEGEFVLGGCILNEANDSCGCLLCDTTWNEKEWIFLLAENWKGH